MQYGNWTDGPFSDGSRQKEMSVSVPQAVQENGTWYIHVFMVKRGLPINPEEKEYRETAITYQSKCMSIAELCECCICTLYMCICVVQTPCREQLV